MSLRSLVFFVTLLASPAFTDAADAPAAGDENHLHCDNCDDWNEPQAPFKIHGNTWYVGTSGLSAVLVTGREGHVLLDGALPQSAAQIQANIEALGFRIGDVKLIVNSHEHFDHAGGIAALQRASGATVAASAVGARVLRQGTVASDDPQFDARSPVHVPKVAKVREVSDGQVLKVGTIAVTAHATPGHTPGATTWSWVSREAGQCQDVVYADSLNPVSSDGFRFSGGDARPDISRSFAASVAKLAALDCDIVLSTHPGATETLEKQAARTPARNPFVDSTGCRKYAAVAADRLKLRLAQERSSHTQAQTVPDDSDGLRSGALFDELARMDAILFDASFASCDAEKANAIFTDDVEFYHDQTGLSVGEQVRENTRRLTAACPGARGVTRTIVPGSLRVYPIKGYGAVQVGTHRFDERGAATSTIARFVSVWRSHEGKWRLARVLSLDHRAVDPKHPALIFK